MQGWSSRLNADDPPPWTTAKREKAQSKDEFKDYNWRVYIAQDYDAEGWLYGKSFDDEMGPKTMSSVVRSRVWLGKLQIDEGKATATTTTVAAIATTNTVPTPVAPGTARSSVSHAQPQPQPQPQPPPPQQQQLQLQGSASSLFPTIQPNRPNSANEKAAPRSNAGSSQKSLFPKLAIPSDRTVAPAQGPVTLFPPLESPSPSAAPTAPSPSMNSPTQRRSIIGKVSAATLSLPTSAVMNTVQSLREVGLYALESAQAATHAAISAQPTVPKAVLNNVQEDPNQKVCEANSVLRLKFPDLSPVERGLVTCCAVDNASVRPSSPPEPANGSACAQCHSGFGLTKFRYACGYCGGSYCHDCLGSSKVLHAFGQTTPSKICAICALIIDQKVDQQQIQWRTERVRDFLNNQLILYFNTTTDTTFDKVIRAAEGTLVAAKAAPIGATAKMAVVSAEFLHKYGRAGLLGFILRNEFMQSFATLKTLLGDVENLGFQDAAFGTYYFMAMNRGERGANPDMERDAHAGSPKISDELLADILRFAPLGLHAIYELDVLDIQRISKLQNFELIYAHVQGHNVRHPSFALLGNRSNKTALLLIRGSKSVQDLLTDIQAHPEEMGDKSDAHANGFVDAFAHNGMLRAAVWIKDRIVDSLRVLYEEGYEFVFSGHSLGGGCAALLTVMLRSEFERVRCFAYAVPACVNEKVAESCVDYVHSIVLRDDFVPRAKASNVRRLVEQLIDFKGCWRDTASEDIEAFKQRAKNIWAPRKREWAKGEADMKKRSPAHSVASSSCGVSPGAPSSPASSGGTKTPVENGEKDKVVDAAKGPSEVVNWSLTRENLIERMKSMTKSGQAVGSAQPGSDGIDPNSITLADVQAAEEASKVKIDDQKELYIPGQVTFLYYWKGTFEAVNVSRKCDTLSQIPVYQNMLTDHHGKYYLNALRTTRDFRKMKPEIPEWVPFGTKMRCMCCDSPFTWNSTSSSEAQQNMDQHNCRKCGWLVCNGCSSKPKSIPEYGINVPVRVCDRCFYDA